MASLGIFYMSRRISRALSEKIDFLCFRSADIKLIERHLEKNAFKKQVNGEQQYVIFKYTPPKQRLDCNNVFY